ncbi:LysR family transcriptional regulator [Neorhizobium alkalisoli]|jgi:DNA-binding transcriptional LysR family regulator|uniref:HTH-type transcriptional regulator TtuA n=1 Tax=Neorhizobium alkalisoli TaxID=528178 RepID=A0A561Q7X9_9HYPH|nr:LysR family transcriptional regulator [Neorhizobium alkalisoli]TWF46449.1 DNA-binding transcriptional LysR family regulator [Neorhizobium alkalisoli]
MHASILRYFTEVARSGSIRRASEELHVATSAVSRQIKKLEDELGTPLFDRFPDGLRLTSAGEIVLRHATETLQDFEVMKSNLGDLQGKNTGRVHIAALDSMLVTFLPDFIKRFHKLHPAVDFRVRAGAYNNIFHFMAGGDIDIGITFDLATPPDLRLAGSIKTAFMAMVAPSHPLARSKYVTLPECAQYKLLLALDSEVVSSAIAVELGALNRVGRTLVASNNPILLKPLIMSGDGIGFFTPVGLWPEIQSGEIVAIPIRDFKLSTVDIGVFVPRDRHLTHASQAVVELLVTEMRKLGENLKAIVNR